MLDETTGDGIGQAAPRRSWPLLLTRVGVILGICLACWGIQNAYHRNQVWFFYGGLSGMLVLAAVWLQFNKPRSSEIGWMIWNRCAMVVLMLALIELGYRRTELISAFGPAVPTVIVEPRTLTYEEAKDNLPAYTQWWETYRLENLRDQDSIIQRTQGTPVPWVYKPNGARSFFRGEIRINSLGLLSPEIAVEKGGAYRIVVMGASHTAGAPKEPGDLSWPQQLERLIHERMPGGQRIQIVNTAIAGYTMEHNLHRLKTVVLPLKPDMIITYFGNLEFPKFRDEFPLPRIPADRRGRRASTLIKKIDDQAMNWADSFWRDPMPIEDYESLESRLRTCSIARSYQEYIQIARDAGIQLVVCNFNMAVDRDSPPEAVRLYATTYPNVKFLIEANRLYSAMLPLVIRPETRVRLVDVQAGLNGVCGDQFMDAVHFLDAGNARMAENVFRGIVDLLPASSPPADSVPFLADRPNSGTASQ